ncbi:MAG: hypothetical protein GY696_05465 [Gammaproteobacteria bacterium]|nr:hypothetical protein [Gammaproteobacteria bacterium]
MEYREYYARDTFIRCHPEEWQIKLRDLGAASLTEYLVGAQELQNRDSHGSEIHIPGGPPAFPWGSLRREEGQSGKEWPKQKKESPKKSIRCHFCKKLGHKKVDCRSFAAWTKKKDAEGAESKEEESTDGKSSRIEEHSPSGGARKASVLLSDIVDHCAEGGVRVVSSFSSPQIRCPLDVEGSQVEAVIDSGSDINIISAKFSSLLRHRRRRVGSLVGFAL